LMLTYVNMSSIPTIPSGYLFESMSPSHTKAMPGVLIKDS